jgi:uncharacterized protein (DUF927 family)
LRREEWLAMLLKIFSGYNVEQIEQEFAEFSTAHFVLSQHLAVTSDKDGRCFYVVSALYEPHRLETIDELIEHVNSLGEGTPPLPD